MIININTEAFVASYIREMASAKDQFTTGNLWGVCNKKGISSGMTPSSPCIWRQRNMMQSGASRRRSIQPAEVTAVVFSVGNLAVSRVHAGGRTLPVKYRPTLGLRGRTRKFRGVRRPRYYFNEPRMNYLPPFEYFPV
jgi:hypothetical protein